MFSECNVWVILGWSKCCTNIKVVVVFDDDKEEERAHRRIGSRNMNIKTSSLCRRLGLVIYLLN